VISYKGLGMERLESMKQCYQPELNYLQSSLLIPAYFLVSSCSHLTSNQAIFVKFTITAYLNINKGSFHFKQQNL